MALRSFDSQTRLGIPRPPKSERAPQYVPQVEQYADEGTLILEPAPISVVPPPPPSSLRPMMYSVPPPSSVRAPMPSWDDRSGWVPPAGPNEITASTRLPAKRQVSAGERSASAMLIIATAAMLAALASIGFMHRASRQTQSENESVAAAAQPIVQPVPQPVVGVSNTATIPAPSAAPIAPPVQPIDIDDVTPAPPPPKVAPVAPVAAVATPPQSNTTPAKPAATEPKPKAPSSTAQQKALEDLLEQLGEEQLKR
jgi:hypothetical protein